MNKKSGFLAALIISLLIGISNYTWVTLDTQPQPIIDQYVEKIFNLADGLTEKNIKDYPRLFYWATIGPRPPAYQVMAAPFTLAFDRTVDSILIVNAIFLILLGLFTYKIAERIVPPFYAVIATLIVTTFPLTTELSKVARAHTITPAIIALGIWLCLICIQQRSIKSAWLLAATFLFAFFTHPSTLYLLIGAIAVVGLFAISHKTNNTNTLVNFPYSLNINHPYFLKGLLPSFSLCLLIICSWMYLKWDQYITLKTVIAEIFVPNSFWELEKSMPFAISWPYTIILAISLFILLSNLITSKLKFHKETYYIALFLLLMFITFHLSGSSIYWHTFSGSISLIAILCSVGLMQTSNFINNIKLNITLKKSLSSSLIIAACFFSIFNYLQTAWGINSSATTNCPLAINMCETNNIRSIKPLAGNWMVKETIGEILKDEKCHNEHCNITLVSHRPRYYSDEVFTDGMVEYFAQETRKKSDHFYPQRLLTFNRIGVGPWKELNWLHSDYSIILSTSDNEVIKTPVAYYGATTMEASVASFIFTNIKDNNALYKKVYTAKLPNDQIVTLVKKIQSTSKSQSLNIINSLQLNASSKAALLRQVNNVQY